MTGHTPPRAPRATTTAPGSHPTAPAAPTGLTGPTGSTAQLAHLKQRSPRIRLKCRTTWAWSALANEQQRLNLANRADGVGTGKRATEFGMIDSVL